MRNQMKVIEILHPSKEDKNDFYAKTMCEKCGNTNEYPSLCQNELDGLVTIFDKCNNCWTPSTKDIKFLAQDAYGGVSEAEFDRWLEQHDREVVEATEERIKKLLDGKGETK